MKIFHTADWHIGKLVHKLYMTNDQSYLLDQLIDLIKGDMPSVLIIAGDVYDRSIPPASAVEILDNFFTRVIKETNTKILLISGNHDSADRLRFGSHILEKQGLHITTQIQEIFEPVIINDEHGEVRFYSIPFIEPEIVRDYYKDDEIKNHDLAIKKIIDNIKLDKSVRNVCIGHGYITAGDSLEESESEKPLSIGGSSYVSSSYFNDFDYVALGHLHGPQRVGTEKIRYAGSLMKYSFSEVNQRKGVQIIELESKDKINITEKLFIPLRDFRIIKGELEFLLKKDVYSLGNTDDYIKAILTDKGELLNAFSKLKSVYANILSVDFDRGDLLEEGDFNLDTQAVAKRGTLDLFSDFFEFVERDTLEEDAKQVFVKTYSKIQKEERDA